MSWMDNCVVDGQFVLGDFTIREKIRIEMRQLNGTARPGYPYRRMCDSVKQFREYAGDETIIDMVIHRLNKILATNFMSIMRWMTPAEYVYADLCDPLTAFIKNELHNEKKVEEGRLRMIMTLSIIDQIVERLLFGPQNRCEIAYHNDIPSKPGMGLHDEGIVALQGTFSEMQAKADEAGHSMYEADVSCFDWSVQPWMLRADAGVRCKAAGCRAGTVYADLVMKRCEILSKSIVVTSGGHVFEQVIPGVQKSGSYTTSSTNSRVRVLTGILAGAEDIIAMGDDSVETTADAKRAEERYYDMGFKLKFFKEVQFRDPGDTLEFCAHDWYTDRPAAPCRVPKLLGSFLARKPQTMEQAYELYRALMHDLRHSPRLKWAQALIKQVDWGGEVGFPFDPFTREVGA